MSSHIKTGDGLASANFPDLKECVRGCSKSPRVFDRRPMPFASAISAGHRIEFQKTKGNGSLRASPFGHAPMSHCPEISRPRDKGGSNIQVRAGLIADPDADRGERPIETAIFLLRRIDAAVEHIEEIVRAIAQRDFRVRIAPGHAGKRAEIGNGDVA